MLDAREEFMIGQRVKLSPKGLRLLSGNASLRGTVRGFGRDPHLVLIQRDGLKQADRYHMDFWEFA
jgi:hypothetical protein